jgi:hypothetical protein
VGGDRTDFFVSHAGADRAWAEWVAWQLVAQYLGWALRQAGRYAEARDLDRETLDRKRRILGEGHPRTLITASNLASCLRELDEVKEPGELAQDSLDCHRIPDGNRHTTRATASSIAIDPAGLGDTQNTKGGRQDLRAVT